MSQRLGPGLQGALLRVRQRLVLITALLAVLLPGLLLAPGLVTASPLPAGTLVTTTQLTPTQHTEQAVTNASAITEQLRLKVPEEQRQIWLEAEHATWEPWLASQDGFLGRELLWDPLHGEATLLIRWASRAQWKAIPQAEIDAVQSRFEEQVRERLGSDVPSPFPLLYEGELINPEV